MNKTNNKSSKGKSGKPNSPQTKRTQVVKAAAQSVSSRPPPLRLGYSVQQTKYEDFTITVDSLKANSSGVLKFGPSGRNLSKGMSGVLDSYHQYKIVECLLGYKTFSSDTTAGAFSLEVDTGCSMTQVKSNTLTFGVKQNFITSFKASFINGQAWLATSKDQFYLLYKGNGGDDVAGQFTIKIRIMNQGPA
uniref:Coat protein n=1 Tax=Luteoviridae sp. TaxID=1955165 RepID=A0A9N6YJ55_9LUTE|nr:MAG TPA: coat protein [Luteoviridae sp.]